MIQKYDQIASIVQLSGSECLIEYNKIDECDICSSESFFNLHKPSCSVCGVVINALPCPACTYLNPLDDLEKDNAKCAVCGYALSHSLVIDADEAKFKEIKQLISKSTSSAPAPSHQLKPVGVSSILQSITHDNDAISKKLSTAFSDLDSLMIKADEMVTLSKQISIRVASSSNGTFAKDDLIQFGASIAALGITAVVAGDVGLGEFHSLLAKEMVGVLIKYSEGSEFIYGLTDVYCILNRARGVCKSYLLLTIAMVSPQDLIEACKVLPIDGGLKFRKDFGGGSVIHTKKFGDEDVEERIRNALIEDGSLSASSFARREGVGLGIAKEMLRNEESKGGVVKDDAVSGMYFYRNLILENEI
jgi:ESCRT-II complex subunit VPS36